MLAKSLPFAGAGLLAGLAIAGSPGLRGSLARGARRSADTLGLMAYVSVVSGRAPDVSLLRAASSGPPKGLPMGWAAALPGSHLVAVPAPHEGALSELHDEPDPAPVGAA